MLCVYDRLYRTLSYWLDEPRLHDPSLYVLALPAEYQSQRLVTVFQSQAVCISSALSLATLLECYHPSLLLLVWSPELPLLG